MAFTQAGQRPVDPILTRSLAEGMSTPYLVDAGVLPKVDTKMNRTGTWMVDNARVYNNIEGYNFERARGSERTTLALENPSSGVYNTRIFSSRALIDLDNDVMTDQIGDLEFRRGRQAARAVKLQAEGRLRALLFTGANWETSSTALLPGGSGNQWNVAGATPLADMNAICNTLFALKAYGQRPNTCVISHDVAVALNADAEVRGYLPAAAGPVGVGGRVMSAADSFAQLRTVIGMHIGIAPERVFVGDIVADTANLGQNESQAHLWADNVWFGYVSLEKTLVSPGGKVSTEPSAGFDFNSIDFRAGAYTEINGIHRFVYADQANDYVATNKSLGFLLSDVLL